jgi:hypothetical protein
MPKYGSYSYLSNKAKAENNWSYNVADQLYGEAETITNQKGKTHGMASYNTVKGCGCNVLVGDGHGLGEGRCHTKTCAHIPAHQRRFQNQSKHDRRRAQGDSGYHICQSANVTCRKDVPIFIEKMVSTPLDKGWRKIKISQLDILWNQNDKRSLAKLVPKAWGNVLIFEKEGVVSVLTGFPATPFVRSP